MTSKNDPTQSISAPKIVPEHRRTFVKFIVRGSLILASLAMGLATAEHIFKTRDGGSFPHLNIYQADKDLGVRLQPMAKQKLRFGNNPFFSVRTNKHGFRGTNRSIEKNSILVVGDSQVFGLGVEEQETFSSRLEKLTKRQVINAGVPTYGPQEYTALMDRLLTKFKSTTVIYVVNIGNDILESLRPNTQRHRAWDGWAARIETVPESTIWFPGREWVMGKSHFFHAMRRYFHAPSQDESSTRMPSEGTWEELVSQGGASNQRLKKASERLPQDARDIVGFRTNSESAAPSAEALIKIASVRLNKDFAAKTAHKSSPIFRHLKKAADVAKKHNADLIIATLPLDVQVSDIYWRGYGTKKIDMTGSLSLLEEVTDIAFEVGATGLNLIHGDYERTARSNIGGIFKNSKPISLGETSFLAGDLHLNPEGHTTVAKLIHLYLSKPLLCRCLDLQNSCEGMKTSLPKCLKLSSNSCEQQIECAEKFGIKPQPKPRRRR